MSLPLFFGLLTLASAVAAILIAALGLANRPIARVVGILTVLGALIPLVAMLFLVSETPSGIAQRLNLFGPAGAGTWLSLAYRTDAFAVYAAFGVTVVIAPLLLWMVWRSAPEVTVGTEAPEAPEEAGGTAAENEPEAIGARPARGDWQANLLPLEAWGGYALVLGLESAALVLCFADSIVWFAIAWAVLAVLSWGVGELGAAPADLDRLSLILMALGPILWLAALLPIAGPIGGSRFSDLAGVGGESVLLTLFIMIFLALAGGVYPFNGWVRRRAIYTPPAGFGAVVLAVLPAALFAGGRTYAALQTSAATPDAANLWPQLGAAVPPITIGIVLVLLGALTVAISGLLALAFRDGRTLIALLASAQVGWGMLALGIGRPLSAMALVVLLATTVLGLGAMVASLFAGGMLTRGEEPEGAGPRAFGAPLQPLNLIAWMLGAVALVGAPLFGGFIARQLTTASALTAAQLTIPLAGLAWVGDALLAFALVRATVPAWFAPVGATATPEEEATARLGLEAALGAERTGAPKDETAARGAARTTSAARAESLAQTPEAHEEELGEEESDETDELEEPEEEADEEAAPRVRGPSLGERLRAIQPAELIGLALGVLALVIGIVPTWLFLLGGVAAAQSLLQPGTLGLVLQVLPLGYGAGTTQWLPSLAWIVVAILVVLAALVAEVTRPARRGVRALAPDVAPVAVPATTAALSGLEPEPEELNGLSEPGAVWRDLTGAIDSGWTVPGVTWLLSDLEDQTGEPVGAESEVESEGEMPELPEAEAARRPQDEDGVPPGAAAGPGENPRPAPTRGEGPNDQK